jgi:anti-anti-sigma factor
MCDARRAAAGDRDVVTGAAQPPAKLESTWLRGPHTALIHRTRRGEQARVAAWVSTALSAGSRIFYKHADPDATARHWLDAVLGSEVMLSGRVALIDAARCHADTDGRPAALRTWHLELVERTLREGHPSVAIVCDGRALRTIAPDPATMLTHEKDLTRLAATMPLILLCRYDTATETPAILPDLMGVHTALEDLTFAARRHAGTLSVAGEIDLGNADRFAAVLRAALEENIRIIDLAGLTFLAAAGLHVIETALRQLGSAGRTVTVHGAAPGVRRVLDATGISGMKELIFGA